MILRHTGMHKKENLEYSLIIAIQHSATAEKEKMLANANTKSVENDRYV
jgi:hypothetical protein